jgi:anti-sigma-K factor RskA
MRKLSADLAHALAAEHALGTLRGRARQRFEAIARSDPEVRAVLERWQHGLAPLAEKVPPVEPPARVWAAIESRIAPRESPRGSGFWRAFGLTAGGAASVLLAALLYVRDAPRTEPMFVAVLTASDAAPRMVVTMPSSGMLRVRMVQPWKSAEGKSLELWAIPKEGAPRSLGLVRNEMADTMMPMPPGDERMRGAAMLAVSLEPAGGSPTRAPTGPVLCSGPIAPTRKA